MTATESHNPDNKSGIIGSYRYLKTVLIVICFAGLGVLYFSRASHSIGSAMGADDCAYIVLGKALATGHGFVQMSDPGEPPCIFYPFLFPLMLAAIIAVAGIDFFLMHLMVIAGLYLAAIFFFLILRKRMQPIPALLLTLFAFTLLVPYRMLTLILSEFPYLLFSMLCLFFFDRFTEKNNKDPLDFSLALLFCLAAYFTRSVGLTLAGACILEMLLRRERRGVRYVRIPAWVIFAAIFALAAGAWSLRNKMVEEKAAATSYLPDIMLKDTKRPEMGTIDMYDLVNRYQTNLKEYFLTAIYNLSYGLESLTSKGLLSVIVSLIAMVLAAGLWRLLRRGPPVMGAYLIFYFALLINWPYDEYDRFVMPALPLLCLCLFYGIDALLDLLLKPWPALPKSWVLGALITAGLCFNLYFVVRMEIMRHTPRWFPPSPVEIPDAGVAAKIIDWSKTSAFMAPSSKLMLHGQAKLALEYIKKKLPANAVILCRSPDMVYLQTGRHAVGYPFTYNRNKMIEFIREKKITHVFIVGVTWQDDDYLKPAINYRPEMFELLFAPEDWRVEIYEVKREE